MKWCEILSISKTLLSFCQRGILFSKAISAFQYNDINNYYQISINFYLRYFHLQIFGWKREISPRWKIDTIWDRKKKLSRKGIGRHWSIPVFSFVYSAFPILISKRNKSSGNDWAWGWLHSCMSSLWYCHRRKITCDRSYKISYTIVYSLYPCKHVINMHSLW